MNKVRTYSSSQARAQWRDVLDLAASGTDIVIERHGKPVVAVIAYGDYLSLQRADRQVVQALEKKRVLYGHERGQL